MSTVAARSSKASRITGVNCNCFLLPAEHSIRRLSLFVVTTVTTVRIRNEIICAFLLINIHSHIDLEMPESRLVLHSHGRKACCDGAGLAANLPAIAIQGRVSLDIFCMPMFIKSCNVYQIPDLKRGC